MENKKNKMVITTSTRIIYFPWPPKELNPNSRVNWRLRSKITKQYRTACFIIAKQAQGLSSISICDEINILLEFVPPDRRQRDDDNCLASFKAGRDGLADAIGIEDKSFKINKIVLHRIPFIKGGTVIAHILNFK